MVEKCCCIRKMRKVGFVNEELSVREFVCKGVRYRGKKSVFVIAGACKPHVCDNVPLPGVQNTWPAARLMGAPECNDLY